MTRNLDSTAERETSLWMIVAAWILGIEGLRTLLYATFIGTPTVNDGNPLAIFGTTPYVWIAFGTLALVAAIGVLARLPWARYLGSVSAVLTMVALLIGAQYTISSVIAVALPCIVLFVLWRKWPASERVVTQVKPSRAVS